MGTLLSDNMNVTMNVKVLIAVILFMATIFGLYYDLKTDISDAKQEGVLLPVSPIGRPEFELKFNLHANTIKNLKDDFEEFKDDTEDDIKELEREVRDD